MQWSTELGGFAAGLLIAIVTAPVGISGAVFLRPVQVDVLGILAVGVGVIAGIYGIGGGSLIGPILVSSGFTVAAVAPAALAATFITSVVGALTYGVLAGSRPAPSLPTGRPDSPAASAASSVVTSAPTSSPAYRSGLCGPSSVCWPWRSASPT